MTRQRIARAVFVCALGCAGASAQTGWSISATPDANAFVPNGLVEVIESRGDRIYVGGSFSAWGPNTGSYAILDPITGAPASEFPPTNGELRAIEPDGLGGWFVAGTFDRIGSTACDGLAHVSAAGAIHAWAPNVDGEIRALSLAGNVLYAAGSFVLIDGQSRGSLAAFDATTHQLLPWNPGAGVTFASYEGFRAIVAAGGGVYAGGFFQNSFGGQTRKNFIAINGSSGAILPLNPAPDGAVSALESDGVALWLGGNFQQLLATSRQRLAEIDLASSTLAPWTIGANRDVFALARDAGILYVGGGFDVLGGAARIGIGAIDLASDTLTSFAPLPSDSGTELLEVRGVATEQGLVWIGGSFRAMNGQPRRHLAAVDAVTGNLLPFTADLAGASQVYVHSLVSGGSRIGVAGAFLSAGALARHGAAALDADTLELLPWAPQFHIDAAATQPGTVRAFAFEGNRIYVAGSFGYVSGAARARIAAIDAATGLLDPAFDAGLPQNADGIANLLVLPGGVLADAAKLYDRITGQVIPQWITTTNVPPKRTARSYDGSRVILGGSFTEIVDGFAVWPAQSLGALDPVSGNALAGYLDADKAVLAMRADPGRVVIGGSFDLVGGELRRRIAEIDTTDGSVTGFAPVIAGPGSSRVSAVAMTPSMVFCGGSFATVQGSPYLNLAAIHRGTSAPIAWLPQPDDEVLALAIARDRVLVGGAFDSFAAGARPRFAAFRVSTFFATPSTVSVSAGGSVDLKIVAGSKLAGKNHWFVGSATGTSVGFALLGSHVPLDLDTYTLYGFANPVNPFVQGGFGILDSLGRASAVFGLPASSPAWLVGLTLYHAGIVYDPLLGKPVFVSNPAALTFVP